MHRGLSFLFFCPGYDHPEKHKNNKSDYYHKRRLKHDILHNIKYVFDLVKQRLQPEF